MINRYLIKIGERGGVKAVRYTHDGNCNDIPYMPYAGVYYDMTVTANSKKEAIGEARFKINVYKIIKENN